MSINNRIGNVGSTPIYTPVTSTGSAPDTTVQTPASQAVQKAPAVNLFDASTFQKGVSVDAGTGSKVTLPTLSDDELAQAQGLFAQVPDDQKDAVNAASQTLGQALFAQLSAMPPAKLTDDGSDDGSSGALTPLGASSSVQGASAATSLVSSDAVAPNGIASESKAVTQVSRAATTTTEDTTSTQKSYAANAQELNDAVASWPAGTQTQILPFYTVASDGTTKVTQAAQTKEQAKVSAKNAQILGRAVSSSTAGATVNVTVPSPTVVSATQNAASTYAAATSTGTITDNANGNNQVMAAAYMGMAGLQNELGAFATTMENTTNTKKGYDADAQELNDAVASWPAGTDTQVLPKYTTATDGTITVTQVAQTKAEATASAKDAESASQNTGADQQTQMIQMQQMQANYSNAVNMISNIMKSGYDMEKNTIGNIHY